MRYKCYYKRGKLVWFNNNPGNGFVPFGKVPTAHEWNESVPIAKKRVICYDNEL